MARQVLPAVGAVVGFWINGPQGAMWGWQIGSVVGNVVDPQVLPGPQIGEIANQTSQEGGPRPIVFALSPPMPGNIIFSGEPRIVRRRERQGKGGPSVETESVYRTYAIGVCEGPITGFWRIWRNGILVYDNSDNPQLTSAENAEFLQSARLFLGSFTQQPSPDIESLTTPAPAHRGTAYLVQADEDLTDVRGMIPQYVFQVLRCEGEYFTSRPYPVEVGPEAVDGAFVLSGGTLYEVPPPPVVTTEMDPEAVDGGFDLLDDSQLRDPLITTEMDPEAVDGGVDLLDSSLRTALIRYNDADPEAVDGAFVLTGGSLHASE